MCASPCSLATEIPDEERFLLNVTWVIFQSLLPISDQDWAEYKPVEGAKEGLESLKAMGYRYGQSQACLLLPPVSNVQCAALPCSLVLVTHRSIEQEGDEEQLKLWIHRQYPGIFDAKDLIFAGGRERVPPIRRGTPKHKVGIVHPPLRLETTSCLTIFNVSHGFPQICRELGARFLM